MRFAVSAMAAASGLVLFGLAFLGEPEAWLRQAAQRGDPPPPVEILAHPDQDADAAARAPEAGADRPGGQLAARPPAPVPDAPAAPVAAEIPERHEAAGLPVPEHRDARRTPAKAAAPGAKPAPARPRSTDDLSSVLARLRQSGPVMPPERRAPEPDTAPAMQFPPPPALARLAAARAALSGGRAEDARRLLQEAQLLLVFRPVASGGDASEGRGAAASAADVARALEALSGNEPGLCARFMDRAAGDLAGAAPPPFQQAVPPGAGGYAPAYPPR